MGWEIAVATGVAAIAIAALVIRSLTGASRREGAAEGKAAKQQAEEAADAQKRRQKARAAGKRTGADLVRARKKRSRRS